MARQRQLSWHFVGLVVLIVCNIEELKDKTKKNKVKEEDTKRT